VTIRYLPASGTNTDAEEMSAATTAEERFALSAGLSCPTLDDLDLIA
jgi:hypothetical protein